MATNERSPCSVISTRFFAEAGFQASLDSLQSKAFARQSEGAYVGETQ